MTQKDTNPFRYSDSNKRYHTYDYYLRTCFSGKCAKIPLDPGFTCPNIDGKCGIGGCIYCSAGSSGSLETKGLPISEQYRIGREKLSSKWSTARTIPYLQAHTNTYAPLDKLKEIYEEVLSLDGMVGMNIATRADCISDEIAEYLACIAERTHLTVELGLQSVHDRTAEIINRGHTYADFLEGYNRLRASSDKIKICVHLIFGLPGESKEMMLESVRSVASLRPDQIKFHYLFVTRGTVLASMYETGEYTPITRDEYINTVCDAIELLPPETVVGRLTGDAERDELIAPTWGIKKVALINDIDKMLFERSSYQGKYFIDTAK